MTMMDDFYVIEPDSCRGRHRTRPRSRWERRLDIESEGFQCIYCRVYVSSNPLLAGVKNRNHCPYCLWSRHLDLLAAGDRLAACRQKMKPVGLTLKHCAKNYGPTQGELMLVHECLDCGKMSINRIAADDVAETIYELYQKSFGMESSIKASLASSGVDLLGKEDNKMVSERLFREM